MHLGYAEICVNATPEYLLYTYITSIIHYLIHVMYVVNVFNRTGCWLKFADCDYQDSAGGHLIGGHSPQLPGNKQITRLIIIY